MPSGKVTIPSNLK